MKKILFLLLIFSALSCKSSKIYKKISLKEIINKGAIVESKHRLLNYDRYFPYYYLNRDNNFKKTKGDYDNLKHPENIEVNLIVSYSKKFMNIENSLRAQVWIITKNENELKNLKIKVYSDKNGVLNYFSNYNRSRKEPFGVEKLFTKKINSNSNYLRLLSNDKIYVVINGYKYTFISPKVQF